MAGWGPGGVRDHRLRALRLRGSSVRGDPAAAIGVLHVFGSMDRGGAEMRTLDVMRRLPPGRVRLEFCALSGRRGTLDDEIRRLGGEVHPCRLDVGFPVRFAALIQRRHIDIVHSHVHLATGFVLTVARAAGVRRRIAHFRSTGDDRGESLPRRAYRVLMRRLLDAVATDILAVSEGVMTEGWSPAWRDDQRCRVVYNGVDVSAFDHAGAAFAVRRELGLPDGVPLVVLVGRFDPPKHHDKAIEVMAALAGRSPAHLVLVGRGGTPDEARVRRRVAELGLGPRVHFIGERDDVARVLCAADASLLTSVREGLPGVVLESLAAGTPVVASDLPGVREIVDTLPGVFIRRVDEPDATWADDLAALLAAPPTAADRAEARKRFAASRFSIEAASAALLAVWAQEMT
jgi:glycosyltransferase involved in cell wall biosynthesis